MKNKNHKNYQHISKPLAEWKLTSLGTEIHKKAMVSPKSSSAASCCVWGVMFDDGWTTVIVIVQLTAELKARICWVEQMQESIVSLIRHCAGSSANANEAVSQLGWKASIARVQGSLHMRTLTPKKTERKWERLRVSPRSQRSGDKGEEESSGGMGKSPQTWI